MIKINEILKKYKLKAKKIKTIGKTTIIETEKEKIAIKKTNIDSSILQYLKSRNFDYMPKIIENKDYLLTKYIEGYDIPKEKKIIDLIKLTALLHSKTTHYKEVDIENNEKIYNHLNDNINYLYSYYTDLITLIEAKVFMSPSELLFASNITPLYENLDNNKEKLEKWYKLIKEKNKERKVVIHNNLKLDHFIRNEKSYLISWDKAKISSPVFDLYKLYKNHFLDFNYKEILKEYEKIYPLTQDEKILLELLTEIPNNEKIEGTEFEKCQIVSKMLEKINKNKSPETLKQREKQENK